jgi:hypothetical protein
VQDSGRSACVGQFVAVAGWGNGSGKPEKSPGEVALAEQHMA